MKKRFFATLFILVALLLTSVSVQAITFGEPDGGAHPFTGAMIVEFQGNFYQVCSGTLISDTVFLTAAHCTINFENSGLPIYVSFDEDLTDMSTATLIPGTTYTHPAFPDLGMADPKDIAVIVLAAPASSYYPGIQPAQLPTAGLIDQLGAKNGLKGQTFTAVGYGAKRLEKTGGFAPLYNEATRWKAVSSYMSRTSAWLTLSQNPATGDGGTCYGDSGGSNLLGDSNVIVGITSWGDNPCRSTNVTYRVDTPQARAFLSQFVTLP
jgi:secreted trypsin-like serine protease